MALQPGEILDGKYRIVRLLGEGGMGAVYEGENTRIKRRVAIKVLHAAVAEKTDVVQRFEREAQAAGRIGSDHIVEVLDLGNLPSGERFMVMEYMDGQDLTGRIKSKKRLTPQECVPIMHQILEGLAAAHDAQIVHRDLKPDNIFILHKHAGRPDFVKILDFGVSKFNALDAEMSMTRTGAVMGTPYYMSPEQAKGGKVDNRSDLYAIGVVLYQMVTGRVPFNASSFNELLFKIALEAPEPIEQIVPDINPAFVALVTRSMQRDPAARFQSAREFQEALANWHMTAPQAAAGAPATTALPQMPHIPGSNPGLMQSTPGASPSHPGLAQSSPQFGSGSYPSVPGADTPVPGALGVSHSPLAVTPQPSGKKSGLMVALVAVTVGILGAAGIGAYILMKPPAGDSGQASSPTASATTAVNTASADPAGDPAGSAEPTTTSAVAAADTDTADTASTETESAAPATTTYGRGTYTPPSTITTRPKTTKPPETKPPETKPPETKKSNCIKVGGRTVCGGL